MRFLAGTLNLGIFVLNFIVKMCVLLSIFQQPNENDLGDPCDLCDLGGPVGQGGPGGPGGPGGQGGQGGQDDRPLDDMHS